MTEPRPQVTVTYPAIPRPYKTVFRVGVVDGDRLVREPVSDDDVEPPPPPVELDGEVFAGDGPPSAEILSLMEVGDIYIDTNSGNVLRLDSK